MIICKAAHWCLSWYIILTKYISRMYVKTFTFKNHLSRAMFNEWISILIILYRTWRTSKWWTSKSCSKEWRSRPPVGVPAPWWGKPPLTKKKKRTRSQQADRQTGLLRDILEEQRALRLSLESHRAEERALRERQVRAQEEANDLQRDLISWIKGSNN